MRKQGKDRQGCILLSGFLDSGFLFPPFSATILMYSFGFEELDPGEWSAGITKVEGGVILAWASSARFCKCPRLWAGLLGWEYLYFTVSYDNIIMCN